MLDLMNEQNRLDQRDHRVGRERGGVTLVEVIFAIGVILIGLLGLLSILPLAAKRARSAVSLSIAASLGDEIVSKLENRQFLQNSRLGVLAGATTSTVTFQVNQGGTTTNVDREVIVPGSTIIWNPQTQVLATSGGTPIDAFCIDPMFVSSTTLTQAAVLQNAYNEAEFPYYDDNHSPFADPSTDVDWPVTQPRLPRVGVLTPEPLGLISPFLTNLGAFDIAERDNELDVTRPEDRSQNATFDDASVLVSPGGLEYGKRLPEGEFSWLATVDRIPNTEFASVSLVIFQNRDRTFLLPTNTTAPDSPQGNATSERLAYVSFASGFRGGGGGTVHLISNTNTDDSLGNGDWIMLSRAVTRDIAGNITDGIHRWYRVVSASDEPTELTITQPSTTLPFAVPAAPNNTFQAWQHKVFLDGPDWEFGFGLQPLDPLDPNSPDVPARNADGDFSNNTYATILTNVVSVTERIVPLSDL